MKKFASIILITIILAAPVSRYADYIHCLVINSFNIKSDCGCDAKLLPLANLSPNNQNPFTANISIASNLSCDWICENAFSESNQIQVRSHSLLSFYNVIISSGYNREIPKPPEKIMS